MINLLEQPTRGKIELEPGDVVFLCEGLDDCAVVRDLTKNWEKQPKIGTCAEKEAWREEFQLLAKFALMRGLKAIGFLFDAEGARKHRLDELKKWYGAAGLAMPERDGELRVSDLSGGATVTTAYLIVPYGRESGCIEDLFLPQVRESPIAPCIDRLLDCYRDTQASTQPRPKVLLRTFLAHKNGYNTGLNAALRMHHLSCNTPEFGPIRDFANRIAGQVPPPAGMQPP